MKPNHKKLIRQDLTVERREWVKVDLTVPPELVDALAEFCVDHGSGGVVINDDDQSETVLTAYFTHDQWDRSSRELGVYLENLASVLPSATPPSVVASDVKEENWAVAWQDHFKSIPVGRRFMVTPPWLKPDPGDRHLIVIEPAEAFGTGTHATTQGCLILLEEAVEELERTGQSFTVLDVGCGSGILALAAIQLGAREVTAVDNDPTAIASASRNAVLNDDPSALRLECILLEEICAPADIVMANLDRRAILSNLDRLCTLCRRFLIISGITADQWSEVRDQFQAQGMQRVKEIVGGEWAAGLFRAAS